MTAPLSGSFCIIEISQTNCFLLFDEALSCGTLICMLLSLADILHALLEEIKTISSLFRGHFLS